ncbi:MAG: hypothetical protein AAF414_03865 [Pseudomonadota bacterium]
MAPLLKVLTPANQDGGIEACLTSVVALRAQAARMRGRIAGQAQLYSLAI